MRVSNDAPVVFYFALIATAVFLLDRLLLPGLIISYFSAPGVGGGPSILGIVTHIFGHANWAHLASNFILILLVGPILEERYGSATLLFMIVVTAAVTGGVNMLLVPYGLYGASGIAFMMLMLTSLATMKGGRIPVTFIWATVLYLGQEVIMASSADGVSHLAHVIGGSCGAFFGIKYSKLKGRV